MEGARTHSFSIILISLIFLCLGFTLGFYSIYLLPRFYSHKKASPSFIAPNTIMAQRMQAIKEAKKLGKNEYEFEVVRFHPALNKN